MRCVNWPSMRRAIWLALPLMPLLLSCGGRDNLHISANPSFAKRVRYIIGRQDSPDQARVKADLEKKFLSETWYAIDPESGTPNFGISLEFSRRNRTFWFDLKTTLRSTERGFPKRQGHFSSPWRRLPPRKIFYRGELKLQRENESYYEAIVQLPHSCGGSMLMLDRLKTSEFGPILPVTFLRRCLDGFRGIEATFEWDFQTNATIRSRVSKTKPQEPSAPAAHDPH